MTNTCSDFYNVDDSSYPNNYIKYTTFKESRETPN